MRKVPPGWVKASIGAVCELNPPLSKDALDGCAHCSFVPMVAVEEQTGRLDASQVRPFNELRARSYRAFRNNDVLLAKITPSMENGKGAVARGLTNGIGFGSTEFHVLRPQAGVEPWFVMHYVLQKRFRAEARRHMTGTAGQLRVPTAFLKSAVIPLPPTAEQRRIVAAIEEQFSRLDNAQELLGRALRNLELLRGQALETAFVGDWPWTTLGEIADIVGGVTKNTKIQSDPSFVEVPYLRVANVQRGSLDLTTITTIRVPPEKARALELRVGDVLFNEGGDRDKLGRGWIWSGEIEGCIHQNHVFRARLRDDFEPKFVSLHGNIFGRRWFEERGRQTTNLASLNLKTLKSFPVPAPLLDEQREIVSELERWLSLIDALTGEVRQALGRSAALRRSILERAFTGKLVSQDPSDEPASMLLKRITAMRIPVRKPPRSQRRVPA